MSIDDPRILSASMESVGSVTSVRSSGSWIGSVHEKYQSKTPARGCGTPTERQLNFSTPIPVRCDDSPVVSTGRWNLDNFTPGMRFTPDGGMKNPFNRSSEVMAGYQIDMRDSSSTGGASLCILPTPMLHRREPLAEIRSPQFQSIRLPSRPSPTISLWPSPEATPVHIPKKVKPNSRHFPIPRTEKESRRRGSIDNEKLN